MSRWYNALLSALLSVLGFESCSSVINNNEAEEYGCPLVEYQVKGEVTDADSGRPIEGIQAKLGHMFTTDERELSTLYLPTVRVRSCFPCTVRWRCSPV